MEDKEVIKKTDDFDLDSGKDEGGQQTDAYFGAIKL